eukprot:Hpha_TRINITY_DN16637_c1_g3::TRINITY_DN16637_c1_g3_i1::g.179136::m.179136/K16582/TTLL6_13; tubulin polyglutamylase TTLL6/13
MVVPIKGGSILNPPMSPSSLSSSDGEDSPYRTDYRQPRPPARPASLSTGRFQGRAQTGSAESVEQACWELLRRASPGQIISVGEFRREAGMDPLLPTRGSSEAAPPPSTTSDLRRTMRTAKRPSVLIDSSGSRYNVVRECAAVMGWAEDSGASNPGQASVLLLERANQVVWLDTSVSHERMMRLRSGTRVNHFPGMTLLCRKVEGARHLIKLKKLFPEAYSFVPPTYLDYTEFCNNQSNHTKRSWFILKPNTGSQGKGIRLVKNVTRQMFEGNVVQSYIPRPLLIDGVKWDMRVYALVLGCDPLRVFMFQDGLVRMCTEPYAEPSEGNAEHDLMHLTNYAVQKRSRKFVFNADAGKGDTGTKRDFNFLNTYLRQHRYDPSKLWDKVADVIVKTLISVQEHLRHTYRSCFPEGDNLGTACFEILGFDILVDENLDPWLLEVNQAPSFGVDTPLDHKIKRRVILDAMRLLGIDDEENERNRMRDRRMQTARLLTAACGHQYPSAAACLDYRRQERRGGQSREASAFLARRQLVENANRGGYARIFPCHCPLRMDGYMTLIRAGRAAELLGSQLGGVLPSTMHGALVQHYAPLRNSRQPPATGDRNAALRGLTQNVLLASRQPSVSPQSSDESCDFADLLPPPPAPSSTGNTPLTPPPNPGSSPPPPRAGLTAAVIGGAALLAAVVGLERGPQQYTPGLCPRACLQCGVCALGRPERCMRAVRRLQGLLDDALKGRGMRGAAAQYGDLRRVAERNEEVGALLDDIAWGPDWELGAQEWRDLIRRAAFHSKASTRSATEGSARPRSAPAAVGGVSEPRAPKRPKVGPASARSGSVTERAVTPMQPVTQRHRTDVSRSQTPAVIPATSYRPHDLPRRTAYARRPTESLRHSAVPRAPPREIGIPSWR